MAPSKKIRKLKSCRICLAAKSENDVIFDVDSEWARLLVFCCGLTISETNGPQMLCGHCSIKLKDFSEFKTLALKNDCLLDTSILSKNINDSITDVEVLDVKLEDYSDNYQDESYLEWDVPLNEQLKEECCKQDTEATPTLAFKNETRKIKKEPKEKKVKSKVKKKISNSNSFNNESDFIKKYFKIVTLPNAKWKTRYECRNCENLYGRKDWLVPHIQKCCQADIQVHNEKPCVDKVIPSLFYCGLCDFTAAEEDVVLKHVYLHCVNNDLNCKLCEYVGRDQADIVSHRYKHMPEENTFKIQCPACNKQPKNLLTLQFHYRSVHLKKIGGWCSVCNKMFRGYRYFRNHEKLHRAEKCFICDFCGIKFLFRNLIIRHLEEHMDIRKYVCETCGKSFKRNNALTYHIRAFHVKNDPVTCDHCGKKFKNQYSLGIHMKMVRKGNNFICDVCSKGYPTLNLLQKHMFWHTGEKPFGCDTCGARYKSKQILEMHKRKHAGYSPYKCDVCEKQFFSSYQLKVHTSVHTGVRRIQCLVCDKTFNEKKRMLEHCKSKHDSTLAKNGAQCVPLEVVSNI